MANRTAVWENRASSFSSRMAFSLPSGFMVSGITTWSVEMVRHINHGNQNAFLIRHTPYPGYPEVIYSDGEGLNILECSGETPFSIAHENIIPQYKPIYAQLAPATFIPNWSPAIYSVCAALAMEIPEKIRVVGYAHSDELYYYETLQYFEPIIYKFIAVSQEVGDRLGEYMPFRKKDILIRPYPVHTPQNYVRNYTLSTDRPVRIVYAGRLQSRQKRIYDLVFLVRRMITKKINFHLFICGSGPEEQSFREEMYSISSMARRHITFVGNVSPDNMSRVWKSADICLLTSDFEGTSITMLEAMAMGCVPIVTNTSGTQKFIKNNENGFVVGIGDITEMAAIVQMLDIDRSSLARLGIQAHKTLLGGNNSYDHYARWFLRLNKELWQQKKRLWPADRSIYFRSSLK